MNLWMKEKNLTQSVNIEKENGIKLFKNYYDTKKKNMDFEGKHPETKKAYDEERKAYANLDKARRDSPRK